MTEHDQLEVNLQEPVTRGGGIARKPRRGTRSAEGSSAAIRPSRKRAPRKNTAIRGPVRHEAHPAGQPMSPPNELESSSLSAAAKSRIKRAGKKAAASAAAKPRALRRIALSPPVTDPVDQTSVGQAQTQLPVPEPVLEHEEVARLAYSYWENRDHQGGSPEEDWYRAVEELRRRKSPPAIASSY